MAVFAPQALAQETETGTLVDAILQPIVSLMATLLFFKIGGENGFPFIVLWLFVAAIFFTLRMRFINFRGLKHAIQVVQGKFDDPHDAGEVSHFQALATAVSGTVGLGNIAGVAIAIQVGGPGAMFWCLAVCLFAFSTIISWSYYGIQAWAYLFGARSTIIFKCLWANRTTRSATDPRRKRESPVRPREGRTIRVTWCCLA
jgi:Na+/alanine symporter